MWNQFQLPSKARLVFSLLKKQIFERFQFLLLKDHSEVLFHCLYENLAFEHRSLAKRFPILHINFSYKLFKGLHFSWGKLMVDGVEVKRVHISAFTIGELSVQVF